MPSCAGAATAGTGYARVPLTELAPSSGAPEGDPGASVHERTRPASVHERTGPGAALKAEAAYFFFLAALAVPPGRSSSTIRCAP